MIVAIDITWKKAAHGGAMQGVSLVDAHNLQ